MSPLNLKRFVAPDDAILTVVAKPVDISEIDSPEIQNHIEEMFSVAYGEQKDAEKPLMVGLAAPQIGISKRLILVDVKAEGKGVVGDLRLYINPEITWMSEEQGEWYEGCFSTSRVCGIVSRPNKIKISAYTKEGKKLKKNIKAILQEFSSTKLITWTEKNSLPT